MSKILDSRSKTQKTSNCQTPKRVPFWFGFGVWDVFGIWNLEFGVSLVLGAWCLVFLNGCAIGPNYKRTDIDIPSNFRNASNVVSAESIANRLWWDV